MIRKFAYNKIFRTTGMLILFLLLLIFPVSKKYSLEDNYTKNVSNNTKKNEVFLMDHNNYVARTFAKFSYSSDVSLANSLIELLIIDGKLQDKIPNGFKGLLPSTTKINSITINKPYITVDLSSGFYDLKKEDEINAINLIVYNLTTIKDIKSVFILIDGSELNYLPKSKINLNNPLSRKIGVNKINNINSYKSAMATTVYYINKNNLGYYYVPVTIIENNEKDKIKVIIDELTSSNTYETNLMSFLNYNVKLLNYEMNDDILTLNFNDYILNNLDKNDILEEVIYSICLSIRDNYDVSKVIFNVNGKEITKSVIKNIE